MAKVKVDVADRHDRAWCAVREGLDDGCMLEDAIHTTPTPLVPKITTVLDWRRETSS